MDVASFISRLLLHTLGTGLHVLLLAILWSRLRSHAGIRLAFGALTASLLFHSAEAVLLYQEATFTSVSPELQLWLHNVALVGSLLAPAILLHLTSYWAGVPLRLGTLGYAILGVGVAGWLSSEPVWTEGAIATMLLAASAFSLGAAFRRTAGVERKFHFALAVTLAAILAGAAAGPASATFTLTTLLPLLVLAYFIYRYNIFDLMIGRRTLFVLALAMISAIYLYLVRRAADFAELEFEGFGPLIEFGLIFAAAVLWLPLYEWITRFLYRPTQLTLESGKAIIEKAVSILDTGQRAKFLADQLKRVFALRCAVIADSDDSTISVAGRSVAPETLQAAVAGALAYFERVPDDLLHTRRTEQAAVSGVLDAAGFQYAVPLRYENRLAGVFLADVSPRLFLDEREPALLNVCREISHSLEACRQIEKRIDLEKALFEQEHLASLGRVATTIAHEVKNPLSSIRTLAQLMREDSEIDQRYQRDFGYIVSETDRLNSSVTQLLRFARPSPVEKDLVEVHELLEATCGALTREWRQRSVELELRLSDSLRTCLADRQTLQHVVLNLLLNAAQACEAGGKVTLDARLDQSGKVMVVVRDDGPGIPEPIRSQIFEPFFTTRQKGTGLGLAIVKKNVSALGGRIVLRTPVSEGRGTEFAVSFPADRKETAMA